MTTPLSGTPTFGAGRAFMIGNYTNPTPVRALVPQSQSIDIKRKVESLFGSRQLPDEVGAGETEISGKVEFGKVNPRVLADLVFGSSGTTGNYAEADGELGSVPGTTPYTITVANATNFLFDLGVVNKATGQIMTCVQAGSEQAGLSYSVVTTGANKGKYTFAAGDTGNQMSISYGFSQSSVGETITLANQLQGVVGSFQAVHVFPWGTEQNMFVFNKCLASASNLSAKKSGFGNSTIDYSAGCDAYGNLGTATFAEAA